MLFAIATSAFAILLTSARNLWPAPVLANDRNPSFICFSFLWFVFSLVCLSLLPRQRCCHLLNTKLFLIVPVFSSLNVPVTDTGVRISRSFTHS